MFSNADQMRDICTKEGSQPIRMKR